MLVSQVGWAEDRIDRAAFCSFVSLFSPFLFRVLSLVCSVVVCETGARWDESERAWVCREVLLARILNWANFLNTNLCSNLTLNSTSILGTRSGASPLWWKEYYIYSTLLNCNTLFELLKFYNSSLNNYTYLDREHVLVWDVGWAEERKDRAAFSFFSLFVSLSFLRSFRPLLCRRIVWNRCTLGWIRRDLL